MADEELFVTRLEQVDQNLADIAQRLGSLEQTLLTARSEDGATGEGSGSSAGLIALANEAIRRMTQGTTQREILESYLELAGGWVSRAALFLRNDDLLVPWRATGGEAQDLKKVRLGEGGDDQSLLARAVQERTVFYAEDTYVQDLGWDEEDQPKAAACIPLVFGEETPVVLYGDSEKTFSTDGLEFLSLITTLVLQNNGLQAANTRLEATNQSLRANNESLGQETARSQGDIEAQIAAAVAASEEAAQEAQARATAAEEELARQVAAAEEATLAAMIADEEAASAAAAVEEAAQEEPEVETEVSPEEDVEEAETEEESEEDLSEEEAVSEEDESEEESEEDSEEESADQDEDQSQEEDSAKGYDEYREDALRFARLLVSEIKLYNGDAVEQGREGGDVYTRLSHDIDRSREMYERRVHPTVRAKEDCFDAEVIRILAGGEQELLGEDYPGPQID